eukprot:CAMPEP_0184673054 /NCGR_PEP_ID=MMETSP0308-20130426/86451_1 /TAXON_ID=38269 /ORGANISM="Gloeochaete witrockiana, Strain SAG 46.84" /LENGTH=254 /DNA_ID=CAMNT_0027120493 /DNA_START=130 /DNA_END=894 /DNA_ORIENTATION=+
MTATNLAEIRTSTYNYSKWFSLSLMSAESPSYQVYGEGSITSIYFNVQSFFVSQSGSYSAEFSDGGGDFCSVTLHTSFDANSPAEGLISNGESLSPYTQYFVLTTCNLELPSATVSISGEGEIYLGSLPAWAVAKQTSTNNLSPSSGMVTYTVSNEKTLGQSYSVFYGQEPSSVYYHVQALTFSREGIYQASADWRDSCAVALYYSFNPSTPYANVVPFETVLLPRVRYYARTECPSGYTATVTITGPGSIKLE